MARSMTGFGRSQKTLNGRDITVEVKSVNHRYFEFSTRIPKSCGYMEEKFKTLTQQYASRGKVEISLQIVRVQGSDTAVSINKELAKEYLSALREWGNENNIPDDLTLTSFTKFEDIFTVVRPPEDEDALWKDVEEVAKEALSKFVSMREIEGKRMLEDMLTRVEGIEKKVGVVEQRSPETLKEYRLKLEEKMKELLGTSTIDENRLLLEVGIMADKLAVDEETVRLRSHIASFREIAASKDPVGRKLDFLIQEFNRETNTIGSKAQDSEIAHTVVDMKNEIEKIREQVQNLE